MDKDPHRKGTSGQSSRGSEDANLPGLEMQNRLVKMLTLDLRVTGGGGFKRPSQGINVKGEINIFRITTDF